jgi:hypothetical protein
MRLSLVLRVAAFGLLVVWLCMLFAVATSEFKTENTWQTLAKMVTIILYDGGRFLRQDLNVNTVPIVREREVDGKRKVESIDVTPPERAGTFVFIVTTAAGLVVMLVGGLIGLLPKRLMRWVLGVIALLAFMYYLNQRPLIPLYLQMPDAAVYVIMFKTLGAFAVAFVSGLLFALGARSAHRATPA